MCKGTNAEAAFRHRKFAASTGEPESRRAAVECKPSQEGKAVVTNVKGFLVC